jgi:hypothetical protein
MNRQQLLEFDAACRYSLVEADTWLDRFLDGGGCTTKGDLPGGVGKPVYLPQRTSDSLDDDRLNLDGQQRTLRQLLLAAGAGPEVERLRIGGLPGNTSGLAVEEGSWAKFDGTAEDEVAEASVEPEPDRQALACLRLLQANSNTRDHAWVILVASRRLVHLLVEYPVLMHPRVVWDARKLSVVGTARQQTSKSFPNEFEPAPMAHIIANTSQARLPSLELGVPPDAYKAFALHPAVAAGICAEAPRLVTMEPKVGLVTWGRTLGEMLLNSDVIRTICMGNLLRMERMRRAEGLPSMLVGNRQTVEGHERAIALAFHAGWMYSRGNDWQSPLAGHSFEQELRQDVRFHESTLKRTSMHLPQVFSDNCHSAGASTISAQTRFERMLGSFVEAGLLSDELAGSAFARQLMLPAKGEHDELSDYRASSAFVVLLAGASLDETYYLLQRWVDEGHSLDAMHDSVQAHLANSPWMEAVTVLKTQHDMNRHIEATTSAGDSSSTAATARTRRRHGL